jgi:signal transduction histidine kinase
MFESARLKLTLFYLAVLVGFSLLVTICFRAIVSVEFSHANDVQRGAFHRIGLIYFDNPPPTDSSDQTPTGSEPPDQNFAQIQRKQASQTQTRLTHEAVMINIGVIVVGSIFSYWYAGRALKPIQEAHEKQKRFTSDASHELRTPLASMRLENEIFLKQKKFNDTEVRNQISSNLEEVARLERLTTSLLDLNRFETTLLKHEKLDIQDVIAAAVGSATKADAAKAVEFKSTLTKQMVLGDQESLVQLFSILFDNAVKYGPKNGRIEIAGQEDGSEYIVSIRDNGKGISEEDLPHIFERMYRGDKARSNTVSGHGIGLSLAEQIATANGASIEAANHEKDGAVFSVRLTKA